MKLFSALLVLMFAMTISSFSKAQTPQQGVNVNMTSQDYKDMQVCNNLQSTREALDTALAKSKIVEPNYAKMITVVDKCIDEDEQADPEDDGFSCEMADRNCKALVGAHAKDLKDDLTTAKDRLKDAQERVKTARQEANDAAKEAADFQKDSAKERNDLLKEMKDEEADFAKQLHDQKKDFLSNVNGINDQIKKLEADNRKIVIDAKNAMANAEKAKMKARADCRASASQAYSKYLQDLDAAVAARGGKISGGFEGVENYNKYRAFLVAKIKNPEPSESFSLCLSSGDAADTNLSFNKIDTALSMDAFSSQMEQNQKDIKGLQDQIGQEQQMANEQQQQTYKAHYEKMNGFAQQYKDLIQSQKAQADAIAKKQADAKDELSKAQKEETEATNDKDNTERRYNCARNNGGSSSASAEEITGAYATVKAKASQLQNICCNSSQAPSCPGNACASSCSAGGSSYSGKSNSSTSGGKTTK